MIRTTLLSFLLGFFMMAAAQKAYQIDGTFTGLANENIYLLRVSGENRTVLDTVQSNEEGSFTFQLEEETPVGMYIVIRGPGQAVELIFNKENIRFTTSGFEADDQVQIISSVENLLYYDYLYLKGSNLFKMDLLDPLLSDYPKNDPFYSKISGQYQFLETQLKERIAQLAGENPNTLASRYITTDQPLFPPLDLTPDQENQYMKRHYFDRVDFNDTLLIYSSILTSKVVQFMSLYQYKANSQEQLEDQLLMAVDTVLNKAMVNQKTYEFLVDFLVKGFEGIGFEKGLEHIANSNQLEQFCENTERKAKLANKMEFIRKLAPGKQAPAFTAVDMKGQTIVLDSIKANITVLVFWASWCPHCDEVLPIIKNYYDNTTRDEMEVVTFSVDSSKEELEQAIEEGGYTWHNVGELKGWEGEVINQYGIAATPTIFILGKDKTILSKPLGKEQIKADLRVLLDK